jgi:hypothetical protein
MVTILLVSCAAAAPAFADSISDAKIQCQVVYGASTELAVACQQGVSLAFGVPPEDAMTACFKTSEDAPKVVACRKGVAFQARAASRKSGESSSFSYSWSPKRGAVQVDVGDFRAVIGDAEKSIDDCLRASEGSSTPPSCLSGFTAQRKPPE